MVSISSHTIAGISGEPNARLAGWMAEVCITLLICISITLPSVRFSDNFPYLTYEVLLLPLIAALYLWMLLTGAAHTLRFNRMILVAAVYSICVIVSTWYGSAILHHSIVLRDYYEVPKLWVPVIFFTLAYEAELGEPSLRRLFHFFSAAILLVCLYAWAQFLDLGITHTLNRYYSGGEHIDLLLEGVGRVYSTMYNPNVLGQLMSWAAAAFLLGLLLRVGKPLWNLFMILACVVTLTMTASRYGLITTALGIVMVLFMPATRKRKGPKVAMILLLVPVLAVAVILVARAHRSAAGRFESLSNPFETDSARGRFEILWPDALHDFSGSPYIGNGPAKTYFSGIITDSEYLDVLKEFGIIGFLSYLAFFLVPLLWIIQGLRLARQIGPAVEQGLPATLLTLQFGLIIVVLSLVMNIGETTLYDLLLQSFLWMWMGLGARSAERLRVFARRSPWLGAHELFSSRRDASPARADL